MVLGGEIIRDKEIDYYYGKLLEVAQDFVQRRILILAMLTSVSITSKVFTLC
jgi:hypothetical protein